MSAEPTSEDNAPREIHFQSHHGIAEKRIVRSRANRLDQPDADLEKRGTTSVVQLTSVLTVFQTAIAPIT